MFEREIERSVVQSVIQSGTTIESYSEDTPYPSRLVLGWDRPIMPYLRNWLLGVGMMASRLTVTGACCMRVKMVLDG